MKYLKYILIAFLAISILGCTPSPTGTSDTTDPSNPHVSSSLTILSKNISTIAPSSYAGASIVSEASRDTGIYTSRATLSKDETYLSFIGPDGTTFQPMVFESSTGTKVVFRNVLMHDIGDGYSICFMRNLETVKKEPQVIYKEAVIDEETKEIIYEPVEIIIDVTRDYGENTALMDFNTGEVYLLVDPEDYTGLFVDYADYGRTVFGTENAIYMVAWNYGYSEGSSIYRVAKSELSSGRLVPMSNPMTIDWPWIDMVSDSTVVFSGNEKNGTNHLTLIKDTGKDSAPISFEKNNIRFTYTTGNDENIIYLEEFQMVLDDNIIHCMQIRGEYLVMMDITFENDQLSYGDIKTYKTSSGIAPYDFQIMDQEITPTGINVIAKAISETQTSLLQIRFSNGNVSFDEILIPESYSDTDEFILANGRIYWLCNAFSGNESICYTDFNSKQIRTFTFGGKSVASSKINVLDDGTVLFWQYMSGTEIATFSWNLDKEPYPTLLMTADMDVKQIINIDTL